MLNRCLFSACAIVCTSAAAMAQPCTPAFDLTAGTPGASGSVAALYPTDFLRFELLGKWGSDNYQDNSATASKPYNYFGGRPVAILDLGWFKFKVGAEYQKGTAVFQTIGGDPGQPQAKQDPVGERTREGVGASVQFVIDPIVSIGEPPLHQFGIMRETATGQCNGMCVHDLAGDVDTDDRAVVDEELLYPRL